MAFPPLLMTFIFSGINDIRDGWVLAQAVKRRPDLSATAPTVLQGVTFFIDNLVGFGNDFVGGFLDFGL